METNLDLFSAIDEKTNVVDEPMMKLAKLNFLLELNQTKTSTTAYEYINGVKCQVRFVKINPELAQILFDNYNSNNRPVSPANVKTITKEMVNDKWVFNGETITFDENGNLTNGQHRLLGVVKSNKTYTFIVVNGLAQESFSSIDCGRKRYTSDVLAHVGVPSAKNAAAVCKFIWGFKNNKFTASDNNSNQSLGTTDIVDYYFSLKNPNESINFGQTYAKKSGGILLPTVVAGFHNLITEVNFEKGEDFLIKLCTGEDLQVGSPILALRAKLIKVKNDKSYHITMLDLIKNVIYCWEKYLTDEKIKIIKIPENFKIKL